MLLLPFGEMPDSRSGAGKVKLSLENTVELENKEVPKDCSPSSLAVQSGSIIHIAH